MWPILLAEVQLCMSHVGICCTDIHYWLHGGIGDYIIKSPYVPGHEGAGVVSKLGEGVTHLKLGRYLPAGKKTNEERSSPPFHQ